MEWNAFTRSRTFSAYVDITTVLVITTRSLNTNKTKTHHLWPRKSQAKWRCHICLSWYLLLPLAPLVFLAYLFVGVTSSIYWLLPHHCLLWNNGSDVSTIQGWLKGERSGNMEHQRVHPPLLRRCVQGHAYSLLLLCMWVYFCLFFGLFVFPLIIYGCMVHFINLL